MSPQELQQLNDELRERGAQQAQARPIDRQTPDLSESRMREIAREVAQEVLDRLTIKNGTGINASGQGNNITISATANQQSSGGEGSSSASSGGEWRPEKDCSGTTFEAWVRNVVPP